MPGQQTCAPPVIVTLPAQLDAAAEVHGAVASGEEVTVPRALNIVDATGS